MVEIKIVPGVRGRKELKEVMQTKKGSSAIKVDENQTRRISTVSVHDHSFHYSLDLELITIVHIAQRYAVQD